MISFVTGVCAHDIGRNEKKKEALALTAEMIAHASGVPLSTVQRVFSGRTFIVG